MILKMMNNQEWELGYTPNNLKKIRKMYGLTQQDVAELTETATWRTVSRWEKETGDKMSYPKWIKLLDAVKNIPQVK